MDLLQLWEEHIAASRFGAIAATAYGDAEPHRPISAPWTHAEAGRSVSSDTLLRLDSRVAEAAVRLRKTPGVKLPDAVIRATAQVHGLLLVTRNPRDFDPDDPGVRIPYRI